MAWAEADRVQIRMYLGFSDLWLQADPRLESAMTNIQAVPLGTRPGPDPSAAETNARAVLTNLQTIDTQLLNLGNTAGATKVDEVNVDVAREDARLRALGRTFVNRLAKIFDTDPAADIYAPSNVVGNANSRGARIGY